MHDPHDTIAAIASPAGGAARGVIRISGPQSLDCIAPFGVPTRRLRRHSPRSSGHPPGGHFAADGFAATIPCSLFIWPNARSYTRQPSVEIHTVGSPPILQATLATLCRTGDAWPLPGNSRCGLFSPGGST